jgi:hypothetical protein
MLQMPLKYLVRMQEHGHQETPSDSSSFQTGAAGDWQHETLLGLISTSCRSSNIIKTSQNHEPAARRQQGEFVQHAAALVEEQQKQHSGVNAQAAVLVR